MSNNVLIILLVILVVFLFMKKKSEETEDFQAVGKIDMPIQNIWRNGDCVDQAQRGKCVVNSDVEENCKYTCQTHISIPLQSAYIKAMEGAPKQKD